MIFGQNWPFPQKSGLWGSKSTPSPLKWVYNREDMEKMTPKRGQKAKMGSKSRGTPWGMTKMANPNTKSPLKSTKTSKSHPKTGGGSKKDPKMTPEGVKMLKIAKKMAKFQLFSIIEAWVKKLTHLS
jgi:hypothetical protein